MRAIGAAILLWFAVTLVLASDVTHNLTLDVLKTVDIDVEGTYHFALDIAQSYDHLSIKATASHQDSFALSLDRGAASVEVSAGPEPSVEVLHVHPGTLRGTLTCQTAAEATPGRVTLLATAADATVLEFGTRVGPVVTSTRWVLFTLSLAHARSDAPDAPSGSWRAHAYPRPVRIEASRRASVGSRFVPVELFASPGPGVPETGKQFAHHADANADAPSTETEDGRTSLVLHPDPDELTYTVAIHCAECGLPYTYRLATHPIACPGDCSERGVCQDDGRCLCNPLFRGEDCSQADVPLLAAVVVVFVALFVVFRVTRSRLRRVLPSSRSGPRRRTGPAAAIAPGAEPHAGEGDAHGHHHRAPLHPEHI